ncbi:MAG: TetR/AcrR family transcriptional regulator [Terricaulis sp.]|nr:TetR/AcrR family transcriptional regulator [Terricaulis sp.]
MPAPRWKRRADARPEEILEAALSAFTERGFEAARMEDIAKAAGISKAAIYLYFPSKMALLEALIEAKVTPIAQQVAALSAAGLADPKHALRALASMAAHRIADPMIVAVPRPGARALGPLPGDRRILSHACGGDGARRA